MICLSGNCLENDLNASIQTLSMNRKSLPTEINDIEPFILNSYTMLKKFNGYLAHLGLAENAAHVKDLSISEWNNVNFAPKVYNQTDFLIILELK